MTITLPAAKQSRETMSVTPLSARVLLAGTQGVGKTTLLAGWAPETTLLIDTQQGTTLLDDEHYVNHIKTWPDFVELVDLLVSMDHEFLTTGVDLVDDIWHFADAFYAGRNRATASATDDYGRSLKQAQGAFRQEVGRLLSSPLGVWFCSHLEPEKDGDIIRYRSRLDKGVLTYVGGACQYILIAESLGPNRKLHTQPTGRFEAKSRTPLPEPMDLDPRALYAAMDAGLKTKPKPLEAIAS